ncbi:tetratricopeptide repeat protein [Chitinophaga solisilvae]|uniref:Tetratricopeptide repeat protein n=1 Tax=Chitinophaga solisilvae TaxID=1233460 RepID=A0A433WCL8_9BACT|nr:tetratricopeptide repeat protein [Chitinophaga solisilvae]NSL91214.1 tetratricopeptide repeat protein [Chitinophaga solisilvae]
MKPELLQKEAAWKQQTEEGNRLYHLNRYRESISYYYNALEIAEELLTDIDYAYLKTGVPVIDIYIISCNNIAGTYWDLQEPDSSEAYYLKPIQMIEALTQDMQLSRCLRVKASHHLIRVTVSYLDFCKKTRRTVHAGLAAGWQHHLKEKN